MDSPRVFFCSFAAEHSWVTSRAILWNRVDARSRRHQQIDGAFRRRLKTERWTVHNVEELWSPRGTVNMSLF